MADEVGRKGAPASGLLLLLLLELELEAVRVWVMVLVMACGEVEGVMVITTVMRIVEGVGKVMTLVEVVVSVVRAGCSGTVEDEGAGRTPGERLEDAREGGWFEGWNLQPTPPQTNPGMQHPPPISLPHGVLPPAQLDTPPPHVAPLGQQPTGPSPVSGTSTHVSPS